MKQQTSIAIAIIVFVVLIVLGMCLYVVPETKQVVITQFGDFKRVETEAGLHFKIPGLEQANFFDKRILEWDGNAREIPTSDKRYIWVDTFARWRIADPLKFFKSVRDEVTAQGRLDDYINGVVRNQISNSPLIKAIRSSDRKMTLTEAIQLDEMTLSQNVGRGREEITEQILKDARESVEDFGIEIIDIRFKRIKYGDKVLKSIYSQMIAERKSIATKHRSEGEAIRLDILGKIEHEEKQILSEAYKSKQKIMGKADADAIKTYAEAYSQDPDFYAFSQTLESYEKNLGKDSTLILSTNNEYLKYLKSIAD